MDSNKQKVPYLEQYITVTRGAEIIRLFYPYIVHIERKQGVQLQYYCLKLKRYLTRNQRNWSQTVIHTRDGSRHYVQETIEQILEQTENFDFFDDYMEFE